MLSWGLRWTIDDLSPSLIRNLRVAERITLARCRKWHIREHEIGDYILEAQTRVWRYSEEHSRPSAAQLHMLVFRSMVDTCRVLAGRKEKKRHMPAESALLLTVPEPHKAETHELLRYIQKRSSPRMRKVLSMRLQGLPLGTISRRLGIRYQSVTRILAQLQELYRLGVK